MVDKAREIGFCLWECVLRDGVSDDRDGADVSPSVALALAEAIPPLRPALMDFVLAHVGDLVNDKTNAIEENAAADDNHKIPEIVSINSQLFYEIKVAVKIAAVDSVVRKRSWVCAGMECLVRGARSCARFCFDKHAEFELRKRRFWCDRFGPDVRPASCDVHDEIRNDRESYLHNILVFVGRAMAARSTCGESAFLSVLTGDFGVPGMRACCCRTENCPANVRIARRITRAAVEAARLGAKTVARWMIRTAIDEFGRDSVLDLVTRECAAPNPKLQRRRAGAGKRAVCQTVRRRLSRMRGVAGRVVGRVRFRSVREKRDENRARHELRPKLYDKMSHIPLRSSRSSEKTVSGGAPGRADRVEAHIPMEIRHGTRMVR